MQLPLLVGAFVLSQSFAWGAISACATGAQGNSFASYGSSSSTNGCSEIDKTFTNLSLDSATGTIPMTTTNLSIWANGTAPVGDTLGPVTANFDGSAANSWQVSLKNQTQDTTFSYVATANTGGSFPSPSTAGLIWAINSLQLVVTQGPDSNSGATSTVTMNFCLGATTTAGCGNLGTIVGSFVGSNAPTYTCSFAGCVSATGNVVNFTSVTQVAISQSVHLVMDGSNGHEAEIGNIANVFGETAFSGGVPEPSSFLLLGSALAALGALRSRRKKA